MNADLFYADLLAKPERLTALAESLRGADPWATTPITASAHLVLLGMGSSHYANSIAAARLRARGIDAVAELASSDLLPAPRPGTVVVAVSASGGSVETLDAVGRYVGTCPIIAVTNAPGSALCDLADGVIDLLAGPESGGVACRTFQHTLALWLALEATLTARPRHDVAGLLERTAAASVDLVARQGEWLPSFSAAALGPHGTHFVAPARRMSSAQQSSLMLREGPRLPAVGCETGDWSHVDVYLTKTTDYRLVLFAGSRWEPALRDWVTQRGSTMIAVGGDIPGAAFTVRYPGDEDDDVRLLAEVLVAELVAASVWARQST